MKAVTEKLIVQTRLTTWGCGLVCGIGLLTSNATKATASTLNILYSFTGGNDGRQPEAGLMADKNGNLFGTTGGDYSHNGTVFELTEDGTLKTLYSFTGRDDGSRPDGELIADKKGNLFGTTSRGGKNGGGTVFELTKDGTLKTLYSFTGRDDGGYPTAGLIADKEGNLFGTTHSSIPGESYYGTVFELTPDGTLKTLHRFTGSNDGVQPVGELIADKEGNLFGTTQGLGLGGPIACGTVYELPKDGTFKTLHRFTAGNDGCAPYAGLIADKEGNLFGTTSGDGSSDNGTVFKLTKNGTYNILYRFTGGNDGGKPTAGLIADKEGNLFGTTSGRRSDYGTVFELTPNGTLNTLYRFTDDNHGAVYPHAGLTADKNGNLFGTTNSGGTSNYGTVFELTNTPFPTGASAQ